MKNRVLKVMALLFWMAALTGYFFITQWMMGPNGSSITSNVDEVTSFQNRGTFLLLLSMVFTISVFYAFVIKSALPALVKNIVLSGTVFFILFLGAEIFFLHFSESNAIGDRWSNKLWDKQYMNHRTSFRYTDSKGNNQCAYFREPIPAADKKKKKIWFIGDSFTYGFGLEQTSQTFPAVTEQLLNGKIQSINLGDGGAATWSEKEILYSFAQKQGQMPEVVVWQYFGNDIDTKDEGPDIYEKEMAQSRWVNLGRHFFRNKSFLLDYIYWQYFTGNERGTVNTYIDFLNKMYKTDSLIMNGRVMKDSLGYITPYRQHLEPLKEAVAYYKSRGVKFLVIIFPFLWKDGPENAENLYAHRLEQDMKKDTTDVINLTPLVKDIPVEKRVVNSHDLHPSVLVDQIVADTIAKYIAVRFGI